MLTKYVFSDWTSASKMRNYINPDLRVDVEVLVGPEDLEVATDRVVGHSIRVFDRRTNTTLYKVLVEAGVPYTYSLSNEEAIEMLNLIGFNCQFKYLDYEVPLVIKKCMKSLVDLGFTSIKRTIRPCNIVISSDPLEDKWCSLREYQTSNYSDWSFLPINQPVLLKPLLDMSHSESGCDCGCGGEGK